MRGLLVVSIGSLCLMAVPTIINVNNSITDNDLELRVRHIPSNFPISGPDGRTVENVNLHR